MDENTERQDQRVPGSRTLEERTPTRDGKPGTEPQKKKEAVDVRKELREQVVFFGKVCSKKSIFATVPASRTWGWVSMNGRFVTEQKQCLLKLVYCSFPESEFWYNTLNNNKLIQMT